MRLIGNIIWLLVCGLAGAVSYLIAGVLWCITIIGIPFGKQCFKMAALMLMPFGKEIRGNFGKHPIANVIWFIFGGLEIAIGYFVSGVLFCITVIGIPFGKQCFKLMRLSAFPFGASVR